MAGVIRLRVYVVNRDTRERRELGVREYEPNGYVDAFGSQALPPCSCPVCRPADPITSGADRPALEARVSRPRLSIRPSGSAMKPSAWPCRQPVSTPERSGLDAPDSTPRQGTSRSVPEPTGPGETASVGLVSAHTSARGAHLSVIALGTKAPVP